MATTDDCRVAVAETFTFHTRILTIEVDKPPGHLFYVHPNIIRASSKFFREKVSVTNNDHAPELRLPDQEPAVFSAYLHFLYFGKIPCRQVDKEGPFPNDDIVHLEFDMLCRLYMLAERIKDRKAMDAAIGALMSSYNEKDLKDGRRILRNDFITEIYDETKHGSPLRRLMVDMHMWYGDGKFMSTAIDKTLDKDFLLDLARALLVKHGGPPGDGEPIPAGVSVCDYHEPGDCETCVGRKRKRTD